MLKKIISEKWLSAHAVVGFWPTHSRDNDDQVVYDFEIQDHDCGTSCSPLVHDHKTYIPRTDKVRTTFHHLRQQGLKGSGLPNLSLVDFIAPVDSGQVDYSGGFVVSIFGADDKAKAFNDNHDDYNGIMVKALADRLAEAFAEYLHQIVRKEWWAYDTDESLSNDELIAEKYVGIRPAPGYPACPDHTLKAPLFDLLNAKENIGTSLTESLAMYPAASVSGIYYSHPHSKYFALGNITKDQVEDYSSRKNQDITKSEQWLAPNLSYN
jgi:5-methyltetrahydrofolate--homocysteine methyltransferase